MSSPIETWTEIVKEVGYAPAGALPVDKRGAITQRVSALPDEMPRVIPWGWIGAALGDEKHHWLLGLGNALNLVDRDPRERPPAKARFETTLSTMSECTRAHFSDWRDLHVAREGVNGVVFDHDFAKRLLAIEQVKDVRFVRWCGSIDHRVLQGIQKSLPRLEFLDLVDSEIGGVGQRLAKHPNVEDLHCLGLAGVSISDEGVRALAGASNLQALDLGRIPLHEEPLGEDALVALLSSELELEWLGLGHVELSAPVVDALCKSRSSQSLRYLDLQGTSARPLTRLLKKSRWPELRVLELRDSQIKGSTWLKAIAESDGLTKLEYINLSCRDSRHNRLAAKDATILERDKFASLRAFGSAGTGFDAYAFEHLQEECPHLRDARWIGWGTARLAMCMPCVTAEDHRVCCEGDHRCKC